MNQRLKVICLSGKRNSLSLSHTHTHTHTHTHSNKQTNKQTKKTKTKNNNHNNNNNNNNNNKTGRVTSHVSPLTGLMCLGAFRTKREGTGKLLGGIVLYIGKHINRCIFTAYVSAIL